jgi:hypothetical protein
MTFDERVQAFLPLGFTPRQTRFLVTVALHSGYCLRRQYAAFARIRYGAVVRDFLDGLVRRDLATRIAYRRNRGFVYHLQSRPLYRAIGQEDNRNHRATSPALIARKLMLLDLAISEPQADWVVTEAEKVALFTERYRVPLAALPQRRCVAGGEDAGDTIRYFVHKLPIFLAGDPPIPHFVWLETDVREEGCASFLRDHAPLLASLPAWAFVAVAPAGAPNVTGCERAFRRLTQHGSAAVAGFDHDELVWYCRARRAVEQQQFAQLSIPDVRHFRDLHARVTSPAMDALYRDWRIDGDVVLAPRAPEDRVPMSPGQFLVRILPHTYSQFGDLPGVC